MLDVSGPKIDLGMQSKYHGNIKAPSSMPQNKQTLHGEATEAFTLQRKRSQIRYFPSDLRKKNIVEVKFLKIRSLQHRKVPQNWILRINWVLFKLA